MIFMYSADFSLHELSKSETALRMGFDNTPTKEAEAHLKLLCDTHPTACT